MEFKRYTVSLTTDSVEVVEEDNFGAGWVVTETYLGGYDREKENDFGMVKDRLLKAVMHIEE